MEEKEQKEIITMLKKSWCINLVNQGENHAVFHFYFRGDEEEIIPLIVFWNDKEMLIPPYIELSEDEFKLVKAIFLDVLKIDREFRLFKGRYDENLKLIPGKEINERGCKVEEFNEKFERQIISYLDHQFVYEVLPFGCLLNGNENPWDYDERIISRFEEEYPMRILCQDCWYRERCDRYKCTDI